MRWRGLRESGLSPICADLCSVSMAIDGNMSAINSLNTLAKDEIRSQLILAINVNDVVNGVLFAQKWQAYNKHFRSLLVVILLSRSIWRCQ